MLEMGTSGLMSGDGKRDGALSSAPALVLDSTTHDDTQVFAKAASRCMLGVLWGAPF